MRSRGSRLDRVCKCGVMKACFRVVPLLLATCLLPLSGRAQSVQRTGDAIGENLTDYLQTKWLVSGKVKTVQGGPVRGATVTVSPLAAVGTRVLTTDDQGEYRTEYELNVSLIHEFGVVVTAKKKGFQTAHAFADFGKSARTWVLPLTLRGLDEDPALLSPADLISGLAPKLRQLGAAEGLAAKSEKDYTRGVTDFVDQHNPEQAVPHLAKVVANNPSCIACRTMLGLAELSWCDWDDAYNSLAESVNTSLHDPKMGRPEPMVAYGTWLSWQHDMEKAEDFFHEALKFAPQDALALQELGRTLLLEGHPEAANDVLKKALAAGARPDARLLYAESWLGAGHSQEAGAELNRYLDGREVKNMPARVRQAWEAIQNQQKVEALYAKGKAQKNQEVLDFLQHPPADLIRGMESAKDQGQLGSILDGVGTQISEMIKNFPNTSSLEAIHQEILGGKGKVHGSQDQKFRYLCLVPSEAWGPGFVEYRANLQGNEAVPKGLSDGFMLTQGFASAAFVFHPDYRSESNFHYLGRQQMNGRNTYVVAFAQIPEKAHFNGVFRKGTTSVITLSQGLAWIDPDTYRIIRIHSDLLAPLPELRLESETLSIDFNEVHFTSVKAALWLPEDVTVTLDWNGKLLRNRHEYSDFKIFNVDASEKIGKLKSSRHAPKTPEWSAVSQ